MKNPIEIHSFHRNCSACLAAVFDLNSVIMFKAPDTDVDQAAEAELQRLQKQVRRDVIRFVSYNLFNYPSALNGILYIYIHRCGKWKKTVARSSTRKAASTANARKSSKRCVRNGMDSAIRSPICKRVRMQNARMK